jgi:hypothetical protein
MSLGIEMFIGFLSLLYVYISNIEGTSTAEYTCIFTSLN